MNKEILKTIQQLNQFKGLGYNWPSNIDGSTSDVLYKERVILKGNADKFTFCCGLTLEAYLNTCLRIGKDLGSADDVIAMKRKWFIWTVKNPIYLNRGPLDALEPDHGREVTLALSEPGDLIQIWRKSGSGHSAILINQFRENGIQAVKYWSTQKATNGVGYRIEYFDGVKNPITHIHICRPI